MTRLSFSCQSLELRGLFEELRISHVLMFPRRICLRYVLTNVLVCDLQLRLFV
jgi:hypothetical protein